MSPAISIDQKSASNNPRSTVGTITEVYDYLRLLYARAGIAHCPHCQEAIKPLSESEILVQISKNFANKEIMILAPVIQKKSCGHTQENYK